MNEDGKQEAMGKRHIWKTRTYLKEEHIRRLQGTWGSSKMAFGKNRVFTIDDPYVETNIPWTGLRTLCKFARVPLGRAQWVTDTMTTEERYKQD